MQMCAVYARKLIIQDAYCSALNIISSTCDRKKARYENSLYLSPDRSLSLPLNLHSGLHSSLHLSLLGSASKIDRFLQRRGSRQQLSTYIYGFRSGPSLIWKLHPVGCCYGTPILDRVAICRMIKVHSC